jgi:hypothetical protein
MGSILISVPDIPDSDLVYNEDETKQILKFFWPESSNAIDKLALTDDVRRLAQSALIAAVDGSYAMGFIDTLAHVIMRRNRDIRTLVRRLARGFARSYWRHATQHDLEDARIYESVRATIAWQLGDSFAMILRGLASKRGGTPFYARRSSKIIWS